MDGGIDAQLGALQHHAAKPASCIVFQAEQCVDHPVVVHAVVGAGQAVVLATSGVIILGLPRPDLAQRPLDTGVDELTGVPREPVCHIQNLVWPGTVARARSGAHRLIGQGVVLEQRVKHPALVEVDGAADQEIAVACLRRGAAAVDSHVLVFKAHTLRKTQAGKLRSRFTVQVAAGQTHRQQIVVRNLIVP